MDPVFIPSKGRAENCFTHKNLEAYGMHDWIYVVEPPEEDAYIERFRRDGIANPQDHVYPFDVVKFKSPKSEDNPLGFDYLDDHGWHPGDTLTTGPGPARNALHQRAKELGLKAYWMMDDDIHMFASDGFFFQKNTWTQGNANTPGERRLDLIRCFELYERLLDKYDNVGLAEFEKQGLAQNYRKNVHFSINCKTYTCIRFRTDGPTIPWRSRYNDDVIISLDYEKRGFVNISSKIVSYQTPDTQSQGGGMTEAFKVEGTLRKVRYLVKAYPEYAFFVLKYERFHHLVNYSKFTQKLVLSSKGNTLDDIADFNARKSMAKDYVNVANELMADPSSWTNLDDYLRKAWYGKEIIK